MTHLTSTSRDPVCGMDVEIAKSRYSATYRGMDFRFCSAQCLERFQREPSLYATPTRVLDVQPMPKQRRLRIESGDTAAIERACRRIGELMGITSAVRRADGLVVEYDLRRMTLEQVEAVALDEGVRLRGGLHKLRRNWWKFLERNELGNAAHPSSGACCSRPPPRIR